MLEKLSEVQLVAEASNGEEVLRLIRRYQPDVALIENAMSTLNGFEVTARAKRECPRVHVIVLSTQADEECLRQALDCGRLFDNGSICHRARASDQDRPER